MRVIELTRGKSSIIDDADYPKVCPHKWFCDNKGYALRHIRLSKAKVKVVRLHNFIKPPPKGMFVDHIDGDKLNNKRSNLRFATSSQNKQNEKLRSNNTTGVKGVSWHKRSQKFYVSIGLNPKRKYLGEFDTIEEAALVYRRAAKRYFGQFARF